MPQRTAIFIAYTSGLLAAYFFVFTRTQDDATPWWIACGASIIVMLCALFEAFSEFPGASNETE